MGKWAMYRRRGAHHTPGELVPILLQSSAASCGQLETVPTGFLGLALRLTAPQAFTVQALEFSLERSVGFAQNTTGQIWMDQGDGNSPFSMLGSSAAVPASSIPTSLGVVRYEGLSVAIANAQVYWVIIRAAAAVGASELRWGGDLSAGRLMNMTTVPTFSLASNDRARCVDVFGQPG